MREIPVLNNGSKNLVYVADSEPGYSRKKRGRGFTYFHPDGQRVRNRSMRDRFAAMVIPPAWTGVWICLEPNGHIQATGRDDAGRKQYIYHPLWEEMRNEAKFERVYHFGRALPAIRKRVDTDLRKHNLPRDRVLALVVALLDETHIRIGSDAYAKQNGSYGLTTLTAGHAGITGTGVTFEFTGKSGVEHSVDLKNPRLARIVKACEELPGQRLFQYEDGGQIQNVESGDVNDYIRDVAGEEFSAKDFRTWAGTVAAGAALREMGLPKSEKEREKKIVEAVKLVADELGNTPAVCRKYYVHPAILDAYLTGDLGKTYNRAKKRSADDARELDETVVMLLLKKMGYGGSHRRVRGASG